MVRATLGHPQNDESSAMLEPAPTHVFSPLALAAKCLYEFPRSVKGEYDWAELEAFDKEAR
jgi:hypothetical protein